MDSAKPTPLLQGNAQTGFTYDRQTTPTSASGLFLYFLLCHAVIYEKTEGGLNQQYIKSCILSSRRHALRASPGLNGEEFYCRLFWESRGCVRAEYIGNPLFVIVMLFGLVPSLGALLLSMKRPEHVDLAALSCFIQKNMVKVKYFLWVSIRERFIRFY